MRTRRAKPSAVIEATLPVPSTCPCMMWPPRRSVARRDSSTLTFGGGSDAITAPSEERRSVSFITSAVKAPSAIVVAVRQTPLIATESPSAISPVRGVPTNSRTPSPLCSTPRTSPRSWTNPVNTSPLPHAGADQDVLADPLGFHRQRPQRLRDALGALALQRVAGARAADHHRRDEQRDHVDLARVQERARELRAALQQ